MLYEKIQAAKETYFMSMIKGGFTASIVEPTVFNTGVSLSSFAERSNLKYFLAKTVIVTSIIALFFLLLLNQVNATFQKNLYKLKSVEREFKAVADWPEERVEKYRLRARKISSKIKSIIDEVKILWESNDVVDTVGN